MESGKRDLLAPLAAMQDVADAAEAARAALGRAHRHRTNLRKWPLTAAESAIRGARSSSALDGGGLQLDPTAPRMSGDSQKLQQVLLNVIGNAEHAVLGRDERRLMIRTTHTEHQVVITAVDTGVGMTAEVRRRIFEPFYTTKPDGGGTGLGLSVSYGIIHAHGGTISVESELDVGSTVTIVLPAVPPDRL